MIKFKNFIGISSMLIMFFAPGKLKGQNTLITHDAGNVMNGEAPSLAQDNKKVYLAFASGDSIFFSYSGKKEEKFSAPIFVGLLKGLVNVGGRGPKILSNKDQLLIAAPDTSGNFSSWLQTKPGKSWERGARINDVKNIAKEGFLSLASNNNGHFFAVWLDLRNGKKNNIYGARSVDAGKSWRKNQLIYRSPGGSVCECCKPSVVMKDQLVAIMFRNNLKGNRDLYLIQSKDGGKTFGTAQKLGEESWALNGCPMDGGGLMIENNDAIQTVWQRKGNVYSCEQGKKELFVAKGRQGVIAGMNGIYYIAFVNKGKLYLRGARNEIVELGGVTGYPEMLAIDASTILCTWENEHSIQHVFLHN
ncbi:MAG: sialidase family protein [Ginsengibacter sp.]